MATGERGGWWPGGLTARRVVLIAAIFIAGYFSLSIVSNAITQARLSHRETALREQIGTLEERESRVAALRAYMQSDAFVEAVARENGLVRPGEIAVVAVGGAAGAEPLQPGDPWWFRFFQPEDRR